jgi:hypothetical protein
MDIPGGTTIDGVGVIQYHDNGGQPNQLWKLEQI